MRLRCENSTTVVANAWFQLMLQREGQLVTSREANTFFLFSTRGWLDLGIRQSSKWTSIPYGGHGVAGAFPATEGGVHAGWLPSQTNTITLIPRKHCRDTKSPLFVVWDEAGVSHTLQLHHQIMQTPHSEDPQTGFELGSLSCEARVRTTTPYTSRFWQFFMFPQS